MSKDLEKFTSESIRPRKPGIYEHSLCDLLIKGNRTEDPLIKVSTTCEAAQLSKNQKNLDKGAVEVCDLISLSFKQTLILRNVPYVNISWVFPLCEENFNRFIVPWHKIILDFYPLYSEYRHKNYPQSRKRVLGFPTVQHHNKVVEGEDKLKERIIAELSTAQIIIDSSI